VKREIGHAIQATQGLALLYVIAVTLNLFATAVWVQVHGNHLHGAHVPTRAVRVPKPARIHVKAVSVMHLNQQMNHAHVSTLLPVVTPGSLVHGAHVRKPAVVAHKRARLSVSVATALPLRMVNVNQPNLQHLKLVTQGLAQNGAWHVQTNCVVLTQPCQVAQALTQQVQHVQQAVHCAMPPQVDISVVQAPLQSTPLAGNLAHGVHVRKLVTVHKQEL
tara:strand:- start:9681 stop:10337 length:657 start_codon:yes stop_codon:yes gene_type:complete